ncbi:MAG: three-Cys-motif partner protein TcmP [Mesorhizobium sp.]|uniref:three-Cys-motif partner protein TcmP n=1 Tax=Mesorhizobium sp. TaxID=1871066 RepID=UPI000FE78A8F|nr:three-Cys-motif partner protein TcmP [Mesorhizobium sp.]RWC82139.1 MAG: three-Cys-motif partner protein TcmP [Mesorhizobium sp.]
MAGHRYGGPWSEIKVAAVEYYLQCYTAALTPKAMELWYFDAFAGSGDREEERQTGGLLDGKPYETIVETTDGSARKALKVDPPFKHYVFMETDEARLKALTELKAAYPSKDIRVHPGDANEELAKVVSQQPWTRKAKSFHRGVVFLDPFSLQVEWKTLQALAATEALDVWYLFPIRDVTRQLAHKISGIGPKIKRLDLVLGPEWRELYTMPPTPTTTQLDIFGSTTPGELARVAQWRDIEAWFKRRLESEFAYVSDPVPILTSKGRQTFSLFLGVGNRKEAATRLAKHFATYVRKNFAAE